MEAMPTRITIARLGYRAGDALAVVDTRACVTANEVLRRPCRPPAICAVADLTERPVAILAIRSILVNGAYVLELKHGGTRHLGHL